MPSIKACKTKCSHSAMTRDSVSCIHYAQRHIVSLQSDLLGNNINRKKRQLHLCTGKSNASSEECLLLTINETVYSSSTYIYIQRGKITAEIEAAVAVHSSMLQRRWDELNDAAEMLDEVTRTVRWRM